MEADTLSRAHLHPVLFARWIGPRGMDMRLDRRTPRTDGSRPYVSTRDGGEFSEVLTDGIV